jgi:glycerophosphoryl diester phosphodiesterase
LVVGHRGACGYRPEHTLASYELAALMGADYIEPDLVSTADGVLVARHEPEIGSTTDVGSRPEFASRRTVKEVDGESVEGWFVDDFSLEELKTLRACERIPDVRPANVRFDAAWEIPTFEELLELARRLGVGVIPETKHPSYFASVGLPLEPGLVAALDGFGGPVIVQSFETENLRALAGTFAGEIVQLFNSVGLSPADGSGVTYGDLASPKGLAGVAEYAEWVGPPKSYVWRDGAATAFVADAHAAGLRVMPYTFRREAQFLGDFGSAIEEFRAFFAAGVDGVFTDNPDLAVAARLSA